MAQPNTQNPKIYKNKNDAINATKITKFAL